MHNPADDTVTRIALCTLAIERRAAIKARYNGAEVELHPHQLVDRNGTPYLRAANPAKARRIDEAPALGFFHLGGLSDLTLCGHSFEPLSAESTAPARETDTVLATL
ncbi:hypothetical protein N0B51_12470 [Tsuneonella sp. YG55]|uniref:WYL domain-containing protein n=1 Tax=Tsuneonella litorea TaxID=2976475 RepID=A0A9X2W2Y6_9SPHN|nr:hypothetical protein [Tsuneonella litorea]MCT2559792.1 hypothetical protein [Tsuneonella litorea]